ncbi:MAG: hypothetical protein QOK37_2644 [Thermoanaerobaculia bacterium]|nr:hypothetical protein [Thermoanaerobaculia bacterium]
MSMMEVLVAMLIFTVVFLVALGLYSVANRAYLRTDAATIQQQNVRFAMDRMAETLRDSGANYNTLGSAKVADEQIEGAWESAVFVRGDFNNKPDNALKSTTFPIVTISNDEIVGYVLRKPGGDGNNPISLTMKIDFSSPRDATLTGTTLAGEETATVKVAASDLAGQTNPPYQLARVTFDSAGAPKYEVVAEDVFRLSFSYLNSAGANAVTTVGGADADRALRAAVRQIDVTLIGQSSRPDPGYTDPNTYTPAEATATKNLRKLSLTQHIVPPNLGLKGKRHTSLPAITIQPPASLTVCIGHGYYFGLSWPASTSAGVTTYKVHVTAPAAGPDAAYVSTPDITVTGLSLDFKQPTTTARAYTFAVAASTPQADSVFTSSVTATQAENAKSIPSAPANVLGAANPTGDYNNVVTWDAVTTNTLAITDSTCTSSATGSAPPTSPWNITPIDLSYYEVFRVRSTGSNNGAFTIPGTTRVDNQTIGSLVNTTPTGEFSAGNNSRGSFTDHTAAPCTPYFYRVQAWDLSSVSSQGSPAMTAAFSWDLQPTSVVPDAPGGSLGRAAAVTGTTTSSAGNYNVTISWPAVVQTSTGVPASTAHYQVDRYRKVAPASTYSLDLAGIDVYELTTYSDVVPTTVSGNAATYQYYVRALYDCASSRTSLAAGPYTATCTPAGAMTISYPSTGSTITRPDVTSFAPTLSVSGSGWTSATVTITGPSPSTTAVYSQTFTGSPSGSTYTFPTFNMANATTYPDGVYTVSAMASVGACNTPAQTSTFTVQTVICGLQLAATPVFPSTNGASAYTSMTFQIQNTCTVTSFTFNSLKFTWSGADASEYISSIQFGSTTVATLASTTTGGNGKTITLSPAQTIAGGATSSTITLNFSGSTSGSNNGNFTDNANKSGVPGKFGSIIANETLPAAAADELINGSPVP